MNAQQLNFIALANTARECAGIANSVSGTMKWIVTHWNLCCQQAGLINFTTEARYTRRAQLAADMERMAAQLDNLANGCDALTGEKTFEQEAQEVAAQAQFDEWANTHDSRKTESEWIEIDHAEALKDDRAHNSAWCALAMYPHFNELGTDERRRKALNAAHGEALACNAAFDEYRAAQAAPVPAADIDSIDIRTLHEPIEAEYSQPYAAKVVTRAYVARSIARALASQAKHAEKYTAQDVRWLAEHNAEHAHRNGVITGEEYATLYHMINTAGSRPLAILDAMRAALLAGLPVMDAARAA